MSEITKKEESKRGQQKVKKRGQEKEGKKRVIYSEFQDRLYMNRY